MQSYTRITVVIIMVVLAGCSTSPFTTQSIEIKDKTDLDCDGKASQITATASVSSEPGEDVVGVIGYENSDGEVEPVEKFDVSGETTQTVELSYADMDVDSETRIYVLVEADGFLSNEEIGFARTSRIPVESERDDQPVLNPNLIVQKDHPDPGEEIQFSLEEESDEGCGIKAIHWDFGNNGQTDATGSTVSHVFTEEGYHEVTSTMETTTGVETTVSQTILVTDSPGMKFRDAADPVPQSTMYPQGVLQVLLTLVISLGVIFGIRYRV